MKQDQHNDDWNVDLGEPEEYPSFEDVYADTEFCPSCKKPITEDMDSCPYCGDILFRYLKDGMFAPKKGPLTKFVAVIIVTLVILAAVGMLLQSIRL